jgi:hypothetical protein
MTKNYIRYLMVFMLAGFVLLGGANVYANDDFTPRWVKVIDNYDGFYELDNEELTRLYQDLKLWNANYGRPYGELPSKETYNIAFYPDIRGRRFYEITPYVDEYGKDIPANDTVNKANMELRYVLNQSSIISRPDSGTVNLVFNLIPRQHTDVVFARASNTPFFKETSNLCLISYNPKLDKDWSQRKEFFNRAKEFASTVKMYDIPEEGWQNFMYHLRAGMCVNSDVAKWVSEPSGLVLDVKKINNKNRAFSFIFTYAALASARDGYEMIMPKFLSLFEMLEDDGTPVFTMKLLSVDMHSSGGKIVHDADIAFPFTPFIILKEAAKLDYMALKTPDEIADAVFNILLENEFDSEAVANKWLTEEYDSYRMGL